MIEVSMWFPVIVAEFMLVAMILVVVLIVNGRTVQARLRQKIADLREELESAQIPLDIEADEPKPEPAPASAAPEPEAPAGEPKLVLMSQDDVNAATRPKSEGDDEETAEQLCQKLLDATNDQTNKLNSVLERSAALGMKLGAIKSSEQLDDETKSQVQLAIDHMRETDEVLVEAADKGMELEETIRHLQTQSGGGGAGGVDHVSLNEILMARGDGQTEDELEALREEVRQRLLAGVDGGGNTAEAEAKLAALDKEVDDLKTQLEKEKEDFKVVETKLSEITEEYQRLFEQFQPG